MKWLERIFKYAKSKPKVRRSNDTKCGMKANIAVSGTPASPSPKALTGLPTTEGIQGSSEEGQYNPACLVCGGKIEPIKDLGLAMQGGHIVCPSCGEDHTYSILGSSLTLRRTTVPRGWHGPFERSYDRVQMRKSQTQPKPSTQKPQKASPPFDPVLQDFAQAERLLGNYKWNEAVILYSRVISASPENALALFGRARCYKWKQDYTNALRDIDIALRIDPKNADFWHLRGFVYAGMENYEKAITDATKALELSPGHYDAYYLRGRSYYKLSRYEEAEKDFTKCKEIEPHTLNPDEFLKEIKAARASHFEPVYAARPDEAAQILINKALLVVPIVSMETIREGHARLQQSWGSKRLATGSLKHIQSIILKNLEVYASRQDFEKFRIEVDAREDFSQINAFFQNSFNGIRVWRSHDCVCACGNSDFMT